MTTVSDENCQITFNCLSMSQSAGLLQKPMTMYEHSPEVSGNIYKRLQYNKNI